MTGQKKPKRTFLKVVLVFFFIALFIAIFLFGVVLAVVSTCSRGLPDVEKLTKFEPSETSRIFSSDGKVIGVLFKENRFWVAIEDIPQTMQDAMIAIEDERFYSHRGIDPRSIARAAYEDFKGGGASQGASTITMQLARNIFLHPQKSLHRKIQEIILAIQIERRYTKKEILELYFNQIYFGAGAYGIEAAAQTYFGKHAKELTLAESAMIAGLPPAPSVYSPFVDEESAKKRQAYVLDNMVKCGYINTQQAKKAKELQLAYAPRKSEFQLIKYPYFTSYVLKQLSQKYSDDLLYRGGLKIYTTVDLAMQKYGQDAIRDGISLAKNQGMNASNGALVAIDPRNGYIKCMVGGLNYTERNQFNRAWQARRQPGSSFKTFIYTAAIDSGYSPDSLVDDSPVSYQTADGVFWSPGNCDRNFRGTMTFRDAVKWSRNVCAVKVLDKLGIDKVIDYTHRMGIRDPIEHHLSIGLGSAVVTPLDMASAYGVLANGGIRCEPTAIKMIIDPSGTVIEDHRWPQAEEILPESTAFTMTEILKTVIEGGTGTAAQIGREAAGKTGTTDEFRDAWFVGYVPQLTCAVWTGNDDYTQMNHVYGGDLAAPIWANFMKKALARDKKLAFYTDPKGMAGVYLCAETNLRCTGSCPNVVKKYFKTYEVPQKFCSKHGPIKYTPKGRKPDKELASPVKPGGEASAQTSIGPLRPEGQPRPPDAQLPLSGSGGSGAAQPIYRPKAIEIPKPSEEVGRPQAIEIPAPPSEPSHQVIEIPAPPKDEAPEPQNTSPGVEL
ncbi:MAG: PBP1A family penicillin-binding protein [Candidatus Eremiobacteraeota bacterium]|nr:PBP1A family penicillin-binding protein [Candidatus Eremiobacteraeota bacterium]